jgi:hypothetical protein
MNDQYFSGCETAEAASVWLTIKVIRILYRIRLRYPKRDFLIKP